MLLLALGFACCVGPSVAAWALGSGSAATYPILFMWGGAAFGLYTVAVTILRERYRGGELAAAPAALVLMSEGSAARSLGLACVSTCIFPWLPSTEKKK